MNRSINSCFQGHLVQETFGVMTPKGSNVIAPGKEVRRNPGIEGLSFVPALARNFQKDTDRFASKMEPKWYKIYDIRSRIENPTIGSSTL